MKARILILAALLALAACGPKMDDLEKGETGKVPHWRGIYDDRGRVMVAICHNMDLGDSWEHADNPKYAEKYSALGIRIALDYIVYSMTH